MAISKRMRAINERVNPEQSYNAVEAFSLIQELGKDKIKFVESVDAAINLGVNPKKSDQVVRGASLLPHGTGRDVRVAVFAQGDNAEAAKKAGAEIVGFEDLAESIKDKASSNEKFDFDVLIATPDAMRLIGQLGRILGPRGLMPNPKVGTVTTDVAKAVDNAKSGQVAFRTDKAGIIHCTIGKANFSSEQLKENLEKLLVDLKRLKPSTSKGVFLKKVAVSSTMGPGIVLDLGSLSV